MCAIFHRQKGWHSQFCHKCGLYRRRADALRGYLTANPDQLSALVDAAKAADGDSEDQGELVQKLLDIMKQTLDAKGLQQEVNKAKGELTAAAGATGAAAERLVGAERTFSASLQFVCDTVERIM